MSKTRNYQLFSAEEIEVIKEMSKTHSDMEIAQVLGRTKDSVATKRRRLGIYSEYGTLCWMCGRAATVYEEQCSWARNFTPVKDWEAVPQEWVDEIGDSVTIIRSYHVYKCPMFKEEKRKSDRRKCKEIPEISD